MDDSINPLATCDIRGLRTSVFHASRDATHFLLRKKTPCCNRVEEERVCRDTNAVCYDDPRICGMSCVKQSPTSSVRSSYEGSQICSGLFKEVLQTLTDNHARKVDVIGAGAQDLQSNR